MATQRFPLTICLALSAAAAAAPATQPRFRVVASMGKYQQPVGLSEGAAGVFYSIGGGGAPGYAFSITAQGATRQLASFPNGYTQTLLISASDQRHYAMVFGLGGSIINAKPARRQTPRHRREAVHRFLFPFPVRLAR